MKVGPSTFKECDLTGAVGLEGYGPSKASGTPVEAEVQGVPQDASSIWGLAIATALLAGAVKGEPEKKRLEAAPPQAEEEYTEGQLQLAVMSTSHV